MLNKFIFSGRVTKDILLESVPNTGTKFVNFSVASDDPFKKDHTNFFDVEAYGSTAEYLSKYAKRGALVVLICRIRKDIYEGTTGTKQSRYHIICEQVANVVNSQPKEAPMTNPFASEEQSPFSNQIDVPDSELPF